MIRLRSLAAALVLWPHDSSPFTATSLRRPPTAPPSSHRPLRAIPPTARDGEELRLLTFDLDDTLFPIGPAVADANAAQLRTLIARGYADATNEGIVAASKRIRRELRAEGTAITYTDLRMRSIRSEIARAGGGAVDDRAAEAAFDAWLEERHASADRNLFPHARDALEIIRREYPAAVIGAVTNGRGDPSEMPSIAEHFDFCVSGEDEGVFPRRKPDAGIYRAALGRCRELRGDPTARGADDGVGWVHVGDDLANDVGASAACGARAIWFAPDRDDESFEPPAWSTATGEELRKRAAMDEVAREHVSAKIGSLEELPGAIAKVLNR